jgi:hypothetical protein
MDGWLKRFGAALDQIGSDDECTRTAGVERLGRLAAVSSHDDRRRISSVLETLVRERDKAGEQDAPDIRAACEILLTYPAAVVD